MNISKSLRNELNELSLDVFGTASRWQKLVTKGYKELRVRKVTEVVPAEKEGEESTTQEVEVPVKTDFGAYQYDIKYHTVESVREFLLEQKAKLDVVRAHAARQQADALAKREAEVKARELHQELSGSAV